MLRLRMVDDPEDQAPPVELSDEETLVMLGHFAGASPAALVESTGLAAPRIDAIVARLTSLGLIEAQPAELIPIEEEPAELIPIEDEPVATVPFAVEDPLTAEDDLVALLDSAMSGLLVSEVMPEAPPAGTGSAEGKPHDATVAGAAVVARPPAQGVVDDEPVELDVDEPGAETAADTREYKRLFEAELHPRPTEERVALAGTVTGPRLFALCFDPDPSVIIALFDNTATTIEHARLIAFHHRTARGLDELAGRAAIAADTLVHRRLLRNPALNEAMVRRLMGTKRLLEIHKLSLDRDVPERTRGAARALFRTRFTTASPEERVDVVWSTEGRILTAMTGLTFDSRTTSILCSRTYASIMLIQSLARFPATPPALIGHLLRQPLVKRQVHLKNQLLQHPNTPSDAKRRL
jgi:hypothetical protein